MMCPGVDTMGHALVPPSVCKLMAIIIGRRQSMMTQVDCPKV